MAKNLILEDTDISAFLAEHRLPPAYREAVDQYFLPLAKELAEKRKGRECLLIGINGAQGTGKSTLGELLKLVWARNLDWNVVVLSIDDFYLTKSERRLLAERQHPLLQTRGVPGTHDTKLLATVVERLSQLDADESLSVPRFDKSMDDRAPDTGGRIYGPVDAIILEGWCVGTTAQSQATLDDPINSLESDEDQDGTWRTWINAQLAEHYAPVWDALDQLVFLKAPGFDAVFDWRLEQEEKLRDRSSADATGVMSADEVRRFIAHYERLTRHNLETLPRLAEVVIDLDRSHAVAAVHYATSD